jgi:hypothetical protein
MIELTIKQTVNSMEKWAKMLKASIDNNNTEGLDKTSEELELIKHRLSRIISSCENHFKKTNNK